MSTLLRWVLSAVATVALITVFAEYSQRDRVLLADDVTASAAETVPLITASSELPDDETAPGYLLREYEGKLAIFKSSEAEPLYVFNVGVETMSDYDKSALRQGITANDLEELKTLVEDYTS